MMRGNKILIFLLLVFLATRFLGFNQVYHQDEYKWAVISEKGQFNPIHPPMASFFFQKVGHLVGFDHLRLVPIFFSLLAFLFTYLLCRRLYGERVALWVGIILLLSLYNLLASIQIDIDGALLPCFVALLFLAYYQLDTSRWRQKRNYWWGAVLLIALAGGFLTKLSFVIAVAALATEAYLQYKPPLKRLAQAVGILSIGALVVGFAGKMFLLGDQVVRLDDIFDYVHRFDDFNLLTRNYAQVFYLTVKSFLLATPLLLGGLCLAIRHRESWQRYRLWWIFLIYNLLFYYVVFDFSHGGTIERYLMFLVLPCAVLTGLALDRLWQELGRVKFLTLAIATLFLLVAFALINILPLTVLPLQPKFAYLHQLGRFDLQFLIPITGGSGPSGFYVSAVFTSLMWLTAIVGVLFASFSRVPSWRRWGISFFLVASLICNAVLIGELVTGWQYGNVTAVTKEALAEVVANPGIPPVITYYDIGGYELRNAGKYSNRLYTDPRFIGQNNLPSNYSGDRGFFLIVDFPEINKTSSYWQFFNTCDQLKTWQDKLVKAYLFDCKNGNVSLFER